MNQQEIDSAWVIEVESRIDAFERGALAAIPVHGMFQKYDLFSTGFYLSDEEANH